MKTTNETSGMYVVTVLELAERDTRLHRVSRNEYAGPCPGCHGTDRFHVNLNKREGGAWMCRSCWDPQSNGKGWGDAIAYLRHFRGMSFRQARAFVQGQQEDDPFALPTGPAAPTPAGDPSQWRSGPPSEQWQDRARDLVNEARDRLWSNEGQAARDYLYARGLQKDTIKGAKLGSTMYRHPKTGQMAPCVVFPWYDEQDLWRVQMRVIAPDTPRNERYFCLAGSSSSGLYLAQSLTLKRRAVMLVEGEIDALTIVQEAGDLVAVVATGSTSGSRTEHWLARLALIPHLLLAYDNEEQGTHGADYWLSRLPRASRCRPTAHDVNEMLMRGISVRAWVATSIARVCGLLDEEYTAPISAPLDEEGEPSAICALCEYPVDRYTDEGVPYCAPHWIAVMDRALSWQEELA